MEYTHFEFAADSAKQIITFSTAILTVTVTFAKDTLLADRTKVPWSLGGAWFSYLISILGGIWTLLALTGELGSHGTDAPDLWGVNVEIPAFLMCFGFVLGIVLTAIAGWASVRRIVSASVSETQAPDGKSHEG